MAATGGETTVQSRGGSELAALFDDTSACTLTAEQTEGPYYFDVDKIRTDIREDREGAELRLAIRVRDADGCAPLRNAAVEALARGRGRRLLRLRLGSELVDAERASVSCLAILDVQDRPT